MLAGAAGAYLSLAYAPAWLENMTAGKGWIAVSLVIFAMWNPVRALLGAYLFGIIDAMGFQMQSFGVNVPSYFLKMLPYLFTFIILILMTRETKNRRVATPEAFTEAMPMTAAPSWKVTFPVGLATPLLTAARSVTVSP